MLKRGLWAGFGMLEANSSGGHFQQRRKEKAILGLVRYEW